jgi:cell division protein FtsL
MASGVSVASFSSSEVKEIKELRSQVTTDSKEIKDLKSQVKDLMDTVKKTAGGSN